MWLLNAKTLRLHHFLSNPDPPRYAILSHRWDEEEVTFSHMRDCQMVEDGLSSSHADEEKIFPLLSELRQYKINRLKSMKGWKKIERFCEKAIYYDLNWAWVDTVCIDKSSSSELQEAINSMFRWYRFADRCLVYMNDVNMADLQSLKSTREAFRKSVWFKRGWTLQELLAPELGKIIFLDQDWSVIGHDTDLMNDIVSVTKIPRNILSIATTLDNQRYTAMLKCSVAERMSWASRRSVTRPEDVAYCLLGIFAVNMPMLYGEGARKAFERLQLEIIKSSADETIFAWKPYSHYRVGILATAPAKFAEAGGLNSIKSLANHSDLETRGQTFQMTPRGFLMEAILIDRNTPASVPKSLLNHPQWKTRFLCPLLVEPKKEHQSHPDETHETVCLQLECQNRSWYYRVGHIVTETLNWSELAEHGKPEQVCIQNFDPLDDRPRGSFKSQAPKANWMNLNTQRNSAQDKESHLTS